MTALLDRPFGPTAGTVSGQNVLSQNTQGQPSQGILPVTQTFNSSAETIIGNPLVSGNPLCASLPPDLTYEGTPFELNISGYIKTTSTTNITLSLYSGSSNTIGSNTLLKASTATAQNTATAPFWIHGKLIFDSVSGLLCGTVDFYINKTVVASATLANFPTGISKTGDPVVSFVFTLTSSGADGTHLTTINVQKFSVG